MNQKMLKLIKLICFMVLILLVIFPYQFISIYVGTIASVFGEERIERFLEKHTNKDVLYWYCSIITYRIPQYKSVEWLNENKQNFEIIAEGLYEILEPDESVLVKKLSDGEHGEDIMVLHSSSPYMKSQSGLSNEQKQQMRDREEEFNDVFRNSKNILNYLNESGKVEIMCIQFPQKYTAFIQLHTSQNVKSNIGYVYFPNGMGNKDSNSRVGPYRVIETIDNHWQMVDLEVNDTKTW